MTRSVFDATHAVGARATEPARPAYSCKAHDCPMPGAIDGTCGWHWQATGSDWTQVTHTLNDWACISGSINALRRVLVHQPLHHKAQQQVMADCASRIAMEAPAYDLLQPDARESIAAWLHRLSLFLDTCVAGRPHATALRLHQSIGPGRDWARILIARQERGEHVDRLPLTWAKEVAVMGTSGLPADAPVPRETSQPDEDLPPWPELETP